MGATMNVTEFLKVFDALQLLAILFAAMCTTMTDNDELPDGWIHSGATHCTHVDTDAVVWHMRQRQRWAYQHHRPLGAIVRADGYCATRARAMQEALTPPP